MQPAAPPWTPSESRFLFSTGTARARGEPIVLSDVQGRQGQRPGPNILNCMNGMQMDKDGTTGGSPRPQSIACQFGLSQLPSRPFSMRTSSSAKRRFC